MCYKIFSVLELSGGPLTKKYKFEQFHFHWGNNDSEGSEHRVNGKMYPAEVKTTTMNVINPWNVINIHILAPAR